MPRRWRSSTEAVNKPSGRGTPRAGLAGSGRTGSFPAEAPPQGAATARDGVAVRSVPTATVVIHKIQLRRLSAWLVSLGFLPTLKIAYLIKDHYSRIFRF